MSAPKQLPLPLPPAGTGQTQNCFLLGASNRDAFDLVMGDSGWTALSLCGPPRSGKSLLANHWAIQVNGRVVDAAALTMDMVGELSNAPVVVDDIEQLTDPTALFHLYNLLMSAGLPLLLVSREAASQAETGLADLQTRLRALRVAEIHPPDDALLKAILTQLLEDRQIPVSAGIVDYLCKRMERSSEVIIQLVDCLDRSAMASGRPVGREIAAQALNEISQA